MRKEIISKDDVIAYFKEGNKLPKRLNIGVEHEKFIFEKKNRNMFLKGNPFYPFRSKNFVYGNK